MADSRVSGPSRKEWEARKPVIKQLYIDEGRPLSNVMVSGETHHNRVLTFFISSVLTMLQDIMAREHHFVAPYDFLSTLIYSLALCR